MYLKAISNMFQKHLQLIYISRLRTENISYNFLKKLLKSQAFVSYMYFYTKFQL